MCFDALCYSQRFFSHVRMISYLPVLNQYYDVLKCLAQGSACGECRTSNPSVPCQRLYQLSHCAPYRRKDKWRDGWKVRWTSQKQFFSDWGQNATQRKKKMKTIKKTCSSIFIDLFCRHKMGLVVRKPVFRPCNQLRLKLACSATEIISNIELLHIIEPWHVISNNVAFWQV